MNDYARPENIQRAIDIVISFIQSNKYSLDEAFFKMCEDYPYLSRIVPAGDVYMGALEIITRP